MEYLRLCIYWVISAAVSFAGARIWVKVLTNADPTWKAREHKWGQYIFAGVLSILPALLFYFILGSFWQRAIFSPYPAADDFWFYILVNGPAEEGAKFLVFWIIASGLGKVKEPRDGVLVAMLVALGFSFWENIRYILVFGPGVIPARLVWASSGHMAFASIWGYFGGQTILEPPEGRGLCKYRYIAAAVFTSAFIHGMFNFLVTWVGGGAGFMIDLLVYIAALVLLREVLRVPSAYRQFPAQDAAAAVTATRDALKRDPVNLTLRRRLGFYELTLGHEKDALAAWIAIPRIRRDASLDAWITVLESRRGGFTGTACRGRSNDIEKHLARMSRPVRDQLRNRLKFHLKGDALPWIRRIDHFERREGVRLRYESIWGKQ
jgi:hypothetical protein